MRTIIRLPSIPEIRNGKARDNFALYDMSGFADAGLALKDQRGVIWLGNESLHTAARRVRSGDLRHVPASDALMAQLEGQIPLTKAWRVVDDVCGGVPNVPAFIAGIPTNMRRRVRVSAPSAPLSVFIDLTTSGGIEADDMRSRGVAILALVRLLSNYRAVEAWALTALGSYRGDCADYCCVRLDTAPLDLARVAHVLSSVAVARGIGYGLCHQVGRADNGNWPYADVELMRKHGAAILRRVCNPGSEVLFIPPMYLTDASVKAPVAWTKSMLAQYGGVTMDDAA